MQRQRQGQREKKQGNQIGRKWETEQREKQKAREREDRETEKEREKEKERKKYENGTNDGKFEKNSDL